MRTSNLSYTPLQTVIRDKYGRGQYLVSTAYYAPGFGLDDRVKHCWETLVVAYDADGFEPDFGLECDGVRCICREDAIQEHIRLVREYSADL